VDLARAEIVGEHANWSEPLWAVHDLRVTELALQELLQLEPLKRFYKVGRLLAYQLVSGKHFWSSFPFERFPIPILCSGGLLNALEWRQLASKPIYELPAPLYFDVHPFLYQYISDSKYVGVLTKWVGEDCAILYDDNVRGTSSISQALNLLFKRLEESYYFGGIRFVQPVWEGDPPLVQRIWIPKPNHQVYPDIAALLEKAVVDPNILTEFERGLLGTHLKKKRAFNLWYEFTKLVAFPSPWETSFRYGYKFTNVTHRTGKALGRIIAAVALAGLQKLHTPSRIGQFEDAAAAAVSHLELRSRKKFGEKLERVIALARELHILDLGSAADLMPDPRDFMESSPYDYRIRGRIGDNKYFGLPLE
jgi:hypothetical protein